MASSHEIFRITPQGNRDLFMEPERPSEKITVKILLKTPVSALLKGLNKDLAKYNMKAGADRSNTHIIIVKGIPPDYGFGAQNILTLVKNYDKEASIRP